METISVIIPVYKVETYLNRCVQSIVDQSYRHLEIILVDDGSPDHCPQLCDQWAKKDPRIWVVHKKNGGLSDARNAGLAVATGELISFIDSDDWVEPDFFRILYEALSKSNSDIATCEYRKAYEGQALAPTSADYRSHTLGRLEAMSALIDNDVQQVVWNKLYRRSLIEDVLFAKGKYHEDEFWSYQIIGCCNKVAVTDYIGLNYFQRADSIMGETYSKKRLDAVEAKRNRQAYLKNHFPSLKAKGCTNLLFTCLYHGQLAYKHLSGNDRKAVLHTLKSTVKENPLSLKDMGNRSLMHKGWLWLAQCCFPLTCKLRNLLRIGM